MSHIANETVNTNPEPRVKVKLPSPIAKLPAVPSGQHIANQYQNNKSQVFEKGFFEHSKSI
jgi:hypothetical protein